MTPRSTVAVLKTAAPRVPPETSESPSGPAETDWLTRGSRLRIAHGEAIDQRVREREAQIGPLAPDDVRIGDAPGPAEAARDPVGGRVDHGAAVALPARLGPPRGQTLEMVHPRERQVRGVAPEGVRG